jgi:hypothetical protein
MRPERRAVSHFEGAVVYHYRKKTGPGILIGKKGYGPSPPVLAQRMEGKSACFPIQDKAYGAIVILGGNGLEGEKNPHEKKEKPGL